MNFTFSIKKIVFAGLLTLVNMTLMYSQKTASPFDIIPRIENQSVEDSTITIVTSSNPFDMVRVSTANRPEPSSSGGFQVIRKNRPLSAKEQTDKYQRFLFIVILFMVVILTLVVTVFRIFIGKIWEAFLNDNLLNQLMREQSAGVTIGYLILYLMFFINAGIFTMLLSKNFGVKIAASNISSLFLCIGGVAAFFTVKHIILHLLRFVFPIEKEISAYNFTIVVFNIIIGIALVPMVLLTAYAPTHFIRTIIYVTLALMAGALIFRSLRGLFIANRFFAWHKFHFLLYLCAVEIGPVLVTLKLLNLH